MGGYYEFLNNVKIIYGTDVLKDALPECLIELGAKRILLISGPVLNKLGAVDRVKSAIEDKGINIQAIFIDVPNDSSIDTVNKIAGVYRFNNCDSIVALGGGSVIDTAKGVKLLLASGEKSLNDIMGLNMVNKLPKLPFVVIPTTSGTGSEVTAVSVISDTKRDTKLEFMSAELLPDVCLLAPELLYTLPAKATLLTAFDTLTHAVEAYTCRQKNPLSDAAAQKSIEFLGANIRNAVQNGNDYNGRLAMMLSSALAGEAFSNSMVGAVHAIAHALGGVCHLPHDAAVAIMLPWVMEYNLDVSGEYYAELLWYIAGEEVYASFDKDRRAQAFIDYIRNLYNELAILTNAPRTLADLGVSADDFDKIATKALHDGAMMTNPKSMGVAEITSLLRRALK